MRTLISATVGAVLLIAASTPVHAQITLPYDHIHLIEPAAEASAWWETHLPGGRRITEAPNRIMYGSTRLMFLGGQQQGGSQGSVIEHLGFAVADVDAKVRELTGAKARLIEAARDVPGLYRTALLESPWGTRIQLVQEPGAIGLHHVQLRAPDPAAVYAWLLDTFGGQRTRLKGQIDAVVYQDVAGFSTVHIIVAPGESVPSQGRAIDHIGWRSLGPIEQTRATLEGKGVVLTSQPRPLTLPNGPPINFFYVEGPNGARIELVERPGLKPGA